MSEVVPESAPETTPAAVSMGARFLTLPAAAQWGVWFAAIGLLKFGGIFEPPVWDAAMGVFPPAIFLYESGFDIHALLQQGNWWQGGPNVHSLSLYTWLIAVVMRATGNPATTFAVLHLLTFAGVAASLVAFSRTLARDRLPAALILAGTALLLCLPLVLVQVGYLYTEIWVMAFGLYAWAAWRRGHFKLAVAFAAATLFIKMTGIAIAACVGAALLVGLLRRPGNRTHWALLPVLPAALVTVRWLPNWLGAAKVPGPSWGDPDFLWRSLIDRLGSVPDITFLLALGMICSAAAGVLFWLNPAPEPQRPEREPKVSGPGLGGDTERDREAAAGARLIGLLMPFAFSIGILGSVYSQILFLPRYLVPAIPFAISGILVLSHRLGAARISTATLAACAALALANYDGRFYSPEFASFSVVERSHAYQKFHRVQTEIIDAIEKAPARIPVFVSKEIAYMLSDPMMGYVSREMPQIQPLFAPEIKGQAIERMPEEFMLAYSNPGHGGEEAARLAQIAQIRPDIDLRVRRFEHEGFHTTLFWVRRSPAVSGTDHPSGQTAPRTTQAAGR